MSPTPPPEGFAPTLRLLCELLGVDEDCPPGELLHRARTVSFTLPPLLLSAAEHEGRRLGTGSADELRRHRARLALYDEVAAAVAPYGARVLKGPSLARFQPGWAVRTCGDLDLLVADEPAFWRTARRVARSLPVDDVHLTLIGDGPERHLVAGLCAPSDEPWLDPGLKVEIATFACSGDWETVPPRAALPADDAVAQLLLVAEERFQRGFTVRDALDCAAVLASAEAPGPQALAKAAADWHLAPELRELIDFARLFPSLAAVVDHSHSVALAAASAAELARRERLRPADRDAPDGETGPERTRRRLAAGGPVNERLRNGFPVFGMPLGVDGPFPPEDRALLHTAGQDTVATTPLGAFLLVSQELVDPDRYRAAREFAQRLAAGK
ncbi:hypothetical protein AB0K09_32350 [Streptomyces sp. NPDC049577]|uniref:hypothetical protein n=1 Tax=Streptomyces sp. NPDC049577 TaxID=3155153 RepID=UPI00341B31F8